LDTRKINESAPENKRGFVRLKSVSIRVHPWLKTPRNLRLDFFVSLQCYIEESRIADNKFPPWVLHSLFANG
jgi:hypothetical protein